VQPGEFIGELRWYSGDGPDAEADFRATAAQAPESWPWWPLVGGRDGLDDTLLALRETLEQMRRWG
jgi:hypothetical protein